MKYKAIIFDLDGTLLNTLQDLANAINKGLSNLSLPQHSPEVIKYFVGEGREVMAMRSLPEDHRDAATLNKLVACINEEYIQHWEDNTAPYPGIPELLDALSGRDVKMTILSNKPRKFTELTVNKLLSRWHFEIVMGAMPSIPLKPEPAAALNIASQLDINPTDFFYLGDSDTDMKTAVAAGMFPAGATWGFRTEEELLAGGAKALVRYPTDALGLL
jgi:phosphoglycolate phosphatase